MKLSPAFPLLRTERASFQAFRVPSSDGIINYKFQVTLINLGYLIISSSHFTRYLLIFFHRFSDAQNSYERFDRFGFICALLLILRSLSFSIIKENNEYKHYCQKE